MTTREAWDHFKGHLINASKIGRQFIVRADGAPVRPGNVVNLLATLTFFQPTLDDLNPIEIRTDRIF